MHELTIILTVVLLLYGTTMATGKKWYKSAESWDQEWKSGDWEYMDKVAVERSKIAVIGGVLVQMYSHGNASVLDVGCGEGPIADFLTPLQKYHYVGMDISKEAIQIAKKVRGPPLRFVQSASLDFLPKRKFDVIIFSDMLYYDDYEEVLRKYRSFLNPSGIIIISIFHQKTKESHERIFSFARQTFRLIDDLDVSGWTVQGRSGTKSRTAFHIEVYRQKS